VIAVIAPGQADVRDDVVRVGAVQQGNPVVHDDRGRVVDAPGLPAIALR